MISLELHGGIKMLLTDEMLHLIFTIQPRVKLFYKDPFNARRCITVWVGAFLFRCPSYLSLLNSAPALLAAFRFMQL